MFYVYIIQSLKSGRFYIGYTNNLEIRLKQHAEGLTRSTRGRGPFQLIYQESFKTSVEARQREKQIKNYKGGEAFKGLIATFGDVV